MNAFNFLVRQGSGGEDKKGESAGLAVLIVANVSLK